MKILRIYTKLPPLKGGMEKHIFNLSKTQLEQKHHVKVFYNDGESISENDEKISIYKFYKIKPQVIGIVLFHLCIVFKLFFNPKKYDIVHIHGDWSSLLFYKIIKKLTSAKIVVLSLHDQLTKKYVHQKILPKLVKNIDLIFSTGFDAANELKILTNQNVIVQPSGINDIFFEKFDKSFEYSRFKIITVANLFSKKNISLILDISESLPQCDFVIVGSGPEEKYLRSLIKEKKIKNVNMVGFKTPIEVKNYYDNSDCYLLTSFAEGTPTSSLEAMACGLPIVSSTAGGLNHIVKEYENGFIVDNFEKSRYIEKIELLKSNILLRKQIYKNNITLSVKYNWSNVSFNITKEMENNLNEKE